jgi:paraquat-inducible protein B
MGERKHSVLIGAFVVGSLLIVLATAVLLGTLGFGGNREKVVMVFEGSVKGLTVGAPVALRGVEIGQVTDIRLQLSADRADIIMQVEAELSERNVSVVGENIDPSAFLAYLVDNGLRAQLNMQSVLTGLLYIQMDFHPDSSAQLADIDSPHTQIPTIPTELEQLRRTLQSVDYASIAEDIGEIAASLNALMASDDVRALPAQFSQTLDTLTNAGKALQADLAQLQAEVSALMADARGTVQRLDSAIPGLVERAEKSLDALDATLASGEHTLAALGESLDSDSPTRYRVNRALDELADAARALQSLARLLEEQPEALLRGRRTDQP